MTGFDELLGQTSATALLRRMLDSSRIPQALMFHGPSGVGKATAATAFAACLLCENPTSGAACGRCDDCRRAAAVAHPDLLVVTRLPRTEGPKKGELATRITIDQIREVTRLAGLAPRRGRRRLFVIDPADRMNAEAQNALLKTLEEPPGEAVLVLVASRPHLLLPTVRSRCFAVPFSPLGTTDLAALLEQRGIPRDEAQTRAALSAGRPRLAQEIDLEGLRERRDEVVSLLEALATDRSKLIDLPTYAASLAGKDEADLLHGLELLEGLLRDAARAAIGHEGVLVHADIAPRLTRLGERLGAERSALLVESVERLRGYLRFNANRTLIAESLLAAVAGGPLPA